MKRHRPKPLKPIQNHEFAKRYAVIMSVVLAFCGGAYAIYSIVNDGTQPRKRVMETIALKLVPPPPPPPTPPPPPPPKIVEPQKIRPPVDKPPDEPKQEAPPPAALALDAQPGAGGDGFGLASKPGGSDLCLGCTTGGGGGGGSRFGHYASLMQDEIGKRLHEDEKLDVARFRATIRVWLSETGKVSRVELARTTGDGQLDDRIQKMIGTMRALPEAPPRDMPQPVVVRIGATPGFG